MLRFIYPICITCRAHSRNVPPCKPLFMRTQFAGMLSCLDLAANLFILWSCGWFWILWDGVYPKIHWFKMPFSPYKSPSYVSIPVSDTLKYHLVGYTYIKYKWTYNNNNDNHLKKKNIIIITIISNNNKNNNKYIIIIIIITIEKNLSVNKHSNH